MGQDLGAVGQGHLGDPLYLLPMVEDITDRKNAEAALREAEERFSKSFMNNPAWLAVVHMESNKVLEVNDRGQ